MSILKTLNFKKIDAGRVQIVDDMAVVPLIGKEHMTVAEPFSLKFQRTENYGSMVYENEDKERPAIVPTNFMVRGPGAQDHAMSGSGIVLPKHKKTFNTACCIESSQGGYLTDQNNEYDILPIQLRKNLLPLSRRNEQKYSKLWNDIEFWLKGTNVGGYSAHLRYFYDNPIIRESLETFSAEFEPLSSQLGAIILFQDNIVGIEIMPSVMHWNAYWKLLIRGCYGAELIRLKKLGKIISKKLELPKLEGMNFDNITQTIEQFNNGIRNDIIKGLDNIHLDSINSIGKTQDLETVLLQTTTGGGGDLITQNNEPIYLSLVV